MKQTMKLTESQLHQLIRESVKEMLTELDWKTYANAGRKAGQDASISAQRVLNPNGTYDEWVKDAAKALDRAEKFYNKATEQFDNDYGYKNGNVWEDDGTSTKVRMGGSFTSTGEFAPHAVGFRSKGYGDPRKYERGWESYVGQKTPVEFFGDDNAAHAYTAANDEIANWRKGNYVYTPEKGWHLKDSDKLDEAIKRSIRKYLH